MILTKRQFTFWIIVKIVKVLCNHYFWGGFPEGEVNAIELHKHKHLNKWLLITKNWAWQTPKNCLPKRLPVAMPSRLTTSITWSNFRQFCKHALQPNRPLFFRYLRVPANMPTQPFCVTWLKVPQNMWKNWVMTFRLYYTWIMVTALKFVKNVSTMVFHQWWLMVHTTHTKKTLPLPKK